MADATVAEDFQDYTTPHSCRYCAKIVLKSTASNLVIQEAYGRELHPFLPESWPCSSYEDEQTIRNVSQALDEIRGSTFHVIGVREMHEALDNGCLFYKAMNAISYDNCALRGNEGRKMIAILISDEWTATMRALYPASTGDFDPNDQFQPLFHDGGFRILTTTGYPNPQIGAVSGREPHVSLDESFAKAKVWLETCINEHEECKKKASATTKMPARLLSCSITEGTQKIQLVKTSDIAAKLIRYIALSYCWGGNQEIQTSTGNIKEYSESIDPTSLPASIRDAVRTTNGLGLQYLWVDALCIIQDDDDDKAQQIASMADIFEGAELTILASKVATAHGGFLQRLPRYGLTDPDLVFEFTYEDDEGSQSQVILAPLSTGFDYLERRGWTFQERLCSHPSTCDSDCKDLHWCVNHTDRQERPLEYLAPSWSWASLLQPVDYDNKVDYSTSRCSKPCVEIVEVEVKLVSEYNKFGSVTGGHIKLVGVITEAYYEIDEGEGPILERRNGYPNLAPEEISYLGFSPHVYFDAIETDLEVNYECRLTLNPVARFTFYILVLKCDEKLSSLTGLFLRKHPNGQYSRFAQFGEYVDYSNETARVLVQGVRQEITIV
ncbi:hypothetical protein VTL71DRAFT_8733 [Oculimacula yallundae]|uniref:Heterokaryon incompatibility domain-containing protein n=1 Tax=Oculimacula yallundae TaxID=86028 RepID=A0ABR4CYN0_9HELO